MFLDLRKDLTLGWPKLLTCIDKINEVISIPRYSQAQFLNYKERNLLLVPLRGGRKQIASSSTEAFV